MRYGVIEHQFDLPQEPLLIHWCMGWKQSFRLRWEYIHLGQYWKVKSLKQIGCSRYNQLCMLDEKRLKALYHIQGYQMRLRKAFDKNVRTRDLRLEI